MRCPAPCLATAGRGIFRNAWRQPGLRTLSPASPPASPRPLPASPRKANSANRQEEEVPLVFPGETTGKGTDFWRSKSVEELAREQGVKPVENPEELKGDFWPEDESLDDFLGVAASAAPGGKRGSLMPAVVVDTDVVSFDFKGDTRAQLPHPHLAGKLLVMSFMTLAELDRWALERRWGQRRKAKMEQPVRRFVIQPFDRALCLKWAEATYSAHRKGRPMETADAWIAATALALEVPLVTHNAADYAGVDGLTIISERGP